MKTKNRPLILFARFVYWINIQIRKYKEKQIRMMASELALKKMEIEMIEAEKKRK